MATVSSLLRDHVTLQVRSVDRVFMHAYVPGLMTKYQVIRFLLHRGYFIPSPVALGKIGKAFVKDIERFVVANDLPLVHFRKGDCKEDVVAPYIAEARAHGRYGVVLVGVAQEKDSAWRGWREGGPDNHPHFEYSRQSVFPNFFYFYLYDAQFGPAFIKVSSYAPFSMWVGCNGHEWAKRQADQEAIAYSALDNGFAACDDPAGLQTICDRFGAVAIRTFFERWVHRLPSPFTPADRQAGFYYDLAFRQIEFSDTRVFDRSAAGRAWFEATIREHLDLGRPDQVSLVFSRRITRQTPGRFATRVITQGVDPSIQIHYRSSKQKQYFKESKALRTETTINDTRDFGIGRLVTEANFEALKAAALAANAALIELERAGETCAPDADTLRRVVLPSVENGVAAPGLRFGDPRVVALLASVVGFTNIVGGFTNASLRTLVEGHLGRPYSSRQMTYDLRRLTRKGLIAREKGTHRYRLTAKGRRLSMFFTKTYTRILTPSLGHLDPGLPAEVSSRAPVARAWRALDQALDKLIADSGIAA
ncbi:MAG: hypothetical protein NVSMB4_16070 [Acidimicrobiales bacterium]